MHIESERTAKLFTHGGSQAVRLPAEYRFDDASEVAIWRNNADWRGFIELRRTLADDDLADFMRERPQPPAQVRAVMMPCKRAS
jgi:antitoxin VapB